MSEKKENLSIILEIAVLIILWQMFQMERKQIGAVPQ